MSQTVDPSRINQLNSCPMAPGAIIYWMSRDQRLADNWALLYAQEIALERKVPLGIIFCLVPEFAGATFRQYEFMLQGLEQIEMGCRKLQIGFALLLGEPEENLLRYAAKHRIGAVVTDFTALRINRKWKMALAKQLPVPLFEADSHNIVPCLQASNKLEFAARTIRPKIHRQLSHYLTDFPKLKRHPIPWSDSDSPVNWTAARKSLKVDRSVAEVATFASGEKAAAKTLQRFIASKLSHYDRDRNLPHLDGQSNLSPYLHFGQISAQRVALELQRNDPDAAAHESFIEELIVRRELSDNFCHYCEHYDSFAGFPAWAQKTLNEHRSDLRQFVYTREEFESAQTHDQLWNAAQMEMTLTGKMHGYLRMYWAKKILEWSAAPEDALATAIYLNDRYELDGRDPNGYAGIAWSIGGVHDRPWANREIFGMVRYMSYQGCARKFDVAAYIRKHLPEGGSAL